MGKKLRTNKHCYCFFAIVDDINNTVFVGKTYAKNPRAQYYSHLRGEHALTAEYYIDADLTQPEFIILEYVDCTGSMAFRRVLAWYYFFCKAEFKPLISESTSHMLEHLSEVTLSLYSESCAPYTLEDVMRRTVSKPIPSSSIDSSKNAQANNSTLTQLNIRVQEDVKNAFRCFCSDKKITQSDALRLLLLGTDFNHQNLAMQSYLNKQKSLEHQLTEAKQSIEHLTIQQKNEKVTSIQRKKEWVSITKAFLQHIIDHTYHQDHLPIHPQQFRKMDARIAFNAHRYPSEAGINSICLEQLIYGETLPSKYGERKNSALFILGKTDAGEAIKLRWYPCNDFVGISLHEQTYTYYGARWLVGYTPAKDGAMNLVAAVPYDCLPKCKQNVVSEPLHPSLDSIIRGAETKKNGK